MTWWKQYQVSIPDGQRQDCAVRRFEVTEEEAKFGRLRAALTGRGSIQAGWYTKLVKDGEVVMSDTPDEISDLLPVIAQATGKDLVCVVNGLGLGVVTRALLELPNVLRVYAVEIDWRVIELVGTTLNDKYGDRLKLVCADAFKWKPPEKVDIAWHDIWTDLCTDNLQEIATLKRRYGHWAKWQGAWCEDWLRRRVT